MAGPDRPVEKVIVEMTERGTITLPKRMRPASHVFEARLRPDGGIELIPQHLVDASQAWFWTERWQRMEREADADVTAGRVTQADGAAALIEELDSI